MAKMIAPFGEEEYRCIPCGCSHLYHDIFNDWLCPACGFQIRIHAQDSLGHSAVLKRIKASELREIDMVLVRCPGLDPFYPIIEIVPKNGCLYVALKGYRQVKYAPSDIIECIA
jgi:DNA-directed RNA polymerase subunit RPC12/RpoP